MNEYDILKLIAGGENNETEFKEKFDRPERLAREIASFANMQGGKIFIGVSDSGDIAGLQNEGKNNHEWVMDTVIGRYVHPAIFVNYQEMVIDGKKIAVIDVPMGAAKPYIVRNNNREDTYIRMGAVCRLATREQHQRLFEAGGLLYTEKLPIHGSTIDELDNRRLKEYFCGQLKYKNWKVEKKNLLNIHGFSIPQENTPPVCSFFACMLFGKHPCRWLPQAGIRLMAFAGDDMEYDAKMDESLDMPFIGLEDEGAKELSLPDQAMVYLRPHISRDILDAAQSVQRKRQWDYPPEVIRELIINAFAHRDWTRQSVVEVVAYSDRMEITSPGALPNGMTVEKIKAGERTPRNNKIMNIFRDYKFVEDRGMGIRRKVIPLTIKHNGREPDFKATEDYFKVILHKRKKT